MKIVQNSAWIYCCSLNSNNSCIFPDKFHTMWIRILTGLSEAQKAELAKYGLDLPLIQRYFNYLWHFINLDFGISLTLRPRVDINSFIWQRFLTSFSVGIFSVFLTIAIGVPLGIFVGKIQESF